MNRNESIVTDIMHCSLSIFRQECCYFNQTGMLKAQCWFQAAMLLHVMCVSIVDGKKTSLVIIGRNIKSIAYFIMRNLVLHIQTIIFGFFFHSFASS